MVSPGEISLLCRLCLVKDQVNVPIFGEQGDIRQIFLKISSCLPVTVSKEDQLPKNICEGCSDKLDLLFAFWNSSRDAEKTLVSWLKQASVDNANETINAIAKQISAKPVAEVKQETDDGQNIKIQQSSEEGKNDESEEAPPPPKRARRTAAVKAQISISQEDESEEEEDDVDAVEPLTKVEDESDMSDNDGADNQPLSSFVDMPGTSADDQEQAGPSGVGKDGGADAPTEPNVEIKEEDDSDHLNIPDPIRVKKKIKKTLKKKKIPVKKRRKTHPPPVELDEPIECEVCNATYKNNVRFALHTISHSEDGKYSCHLCSYKNVSKYHIEMHVRAHEGTTKFKCEVCQKAFTVSTHALEHKYVHTGEKPFHCELCGKQFMFSRFLAAHKRSQHYEILTGRPLVKFDCKICSKHYASASGLRRHKLSKHNDQGIDLSVLCDICGKRLSSKEKLKFHRRIHTGYKPFACQVCAKAFTKKDQLIEHLRVHTGEKPHICKYCGRGFTQRTPLKIHERTHTGERPYVCVCCGKGFVTKSSVDSHMKTCEGNLMSAFASSWMRHPLPALAQQFLGSADRLLMPEPGASSENKVFPLVSEMSLPKTE